MKKYMIICTLVVSVITNSIFGPMAGKQKPSIPNEITKEESVNNPWESLCDDANNKRAQLLEQAYFDVSSCLTVWEKHYKDTVNSSYYPNKDKNLAQLSTIISELKEMKNRINTLSAGTNEKPTEELYYKISNMNDELTEIVRLIKDYKAGM